MMEDIVFGAPPTLPSGFTPPHRPDQKAGDFAGAPTLSSGFSPPHQSDAVVNFSCVDDLDLAHRLDLADGQGHAVTNEPISVGKSTEPLIPPIRKTLTPSSSFAAGAPTEAGEGDHRRHDSVLSTPKTPSGSRLYSTPPSAPRALIRYTFPEDPEASRPGTQSTGRENYARPRPRISRPRDYIDSYRPQYTDPDRFPGRAFLNPKSRSYNCQGEDWYDDPRRRLVDYSSDLDERAGDSEDETMADTDARKEEDDRRGGDRYNGRDDRRRGYNNKKRRYRPDDEPEWDDYDRRPQRRRREEPVSVRLRREILQLAESGMVVPMNETRDLAKSIADGFNDAEAQESVPLLLIQLVMEQPFKIPFVAATLLYINELNPDVFKEILAHAAAKAQVALETGNWREVKLLLRLFALLHGVFEGDGVFPLLDELFNRVVDLQAASSQDVLGLELVKIILFTIPYLMASGVPVSSLEGKVAELLEKTDIVASSPHELEHLVDPYSGESDREEKPFGYQSVIGLLQKQLQREASNGWQLKIMVRPYVKGHASKLLKEEKPEQTDADGDVPAAEPESEPVEPKKHDFPVLSLPATLSMGPRPLLPETYFSLFADQEIESVPPTTDIAASLVRDAIVDTINLMDFNRITTAKYLINLDYYWSDETFVKRATAFDKLRDVPEGKSTWKPEDLAVDAVFSQIMLLPGPEHKLVYYHSVITETCRIAPAAIAPSLGRAIRFLYRHVEDMDMELIHRFMDWFAHHLSNFDFRWKWTEWIDDVEKDDLHPKKAFIIGVLDKEIRLSFAKRIRETLPEEYHPLVPASKDKEEPDYKYANDELPYAQHAREIHRLLRKKGTNEEIQAVLDIIQKEAAEHGVADPLVPATDALVTSICYFGAKSLSHFISCVGRCQELLQKIGPQSEAAQRQIAASVMDYWKDQPGIGVNIIDKLLNYTILTPMAVLQWAMLDRLGTGAVLSEPWFFEMVANTMNKVTKRIRDMISIRLNLSLPQEQVEYLDETLAKERPALRELFAIIDDAVTGVANGANDAFIEADGSKELNEEKSALIKEWGNRWTRVFRRKAALEEATVGEAAVGSKLEALQVEQDAKDAAAPAPTEIETAPTAAPAESNGDGAAASNEVEMQ